VVVPVDGTGTTSVEAAKALPVPGVQKPPLQVGKWFVVSIDRYSFKDVPMDIIF
jgi:hypothetical protein